MLTGLADAVARLDLGALASARWFAGKTRSPVAARLVDALDVPGSAGALLVLVDLEYEDDKGERYIVPARTLAGELVEAQADDRLWPALAALLAEEQELPGLDGSFVTQAGAVDVPTSGAGRALSDDQSNTSVVLGDALVVKCYRRLLPGVHPEPELLAGLTRSGSRRAPRFGGALVRRTSSGEEALVCAYSFVAGEPVGWERLIERLKDILEAPNRRAADGLLEDARRLGAATAELHVDLVRAFGIEHADATFAARTLEDARARLVDARALASGELARSVARAGDALDDALEGLRRLEGAPLGRCHGDLHVAQFVDSRGGLVVVDFEGEPGSPPAARRQPGTPLRDLACLLLSLDHVAVAAARRLGFGAALARAFEWSEEARRHAEEAYRAGTAGSGLVFDEPLLRALEVEKECHEVVYAETVLPEWAYAPALVLPRLAARLEARP